MLELPIPKFDKSQQLHSRLAEASKRAEEVAASVKLTEGEYFVRSRMHIRDALREDGVTDELDKLVAELLGPTS